MRDRASIAAITFVEFLDNYIGRIDAKTRHITFLRTPTSHSRNRRGYIDAQDRLWFAEYRGNKIAMLDTNWREHQAALGEVERRLHLAEAQ